MLMFSPFSGNKTHLLPSLFFYMSLYRGITRDGPLRPVVGRAGQSTQKRESDFGSKHCRGSYAKRAQVTQLTEGNCP